MGLYRFKEKGPAYGLGHTEGEIVEYDEKKKIHASCLVPVVDKQGKPLGRQVISNKEYSVEYLVESGVITPANESDRSKVKSAEDINSLADKEAARIAALEAKQLSDRKALMK